MFYEFKSVKDVPPGDFKTQFLKDLQNANDLDQIKWIFDGKKNPTDFRNNVEKAIENMQLDAKTAQKFGKNSQEELKDLILENFDKIVNIFKRTDQVGNNYKQGVHWMIRDLNTNGNLFAGKKIKFEHSIPNARPSAGNSFIDLFCINCSPANLKVEYKSGPGSISSSTIKEQFIERDLFNAKSLDEIQWRMEGTGMTKEKLIEYLSTTESREALKKIPAEKANKLLNRLDLDDDFPEEIANALINNFKNDSNFNLIFK